MTIPNAGSIAKKGTDIYQRKFRADFELAHKGKFVAIDVDRAEAYIDDLPETALAKARKAAPQGTFYLLRVGSTGAFTSSRINASAGPGRV